MARSLTGVKFLLFVMFHIPDNGNGAQYSDLINLLINHMLNLFTKILRNLPCLSSSEWPPCGRSPPCYQLWGRPSHYSGVLPERLVLASFGRAPVYHQCTVGTDDTRCTRLPWSVPSTVLPLIQPELYNLEHSTGQRNQCPGEQWKR